MLKQPPLLKQGDKIGVVAPSRMITQSQMLKAFEVFEEWRLEVLTGKSLFAQNGYFAGSDEERQADLQEMLDNPEIKAIFCARGGYGMTRIIDQLDFNTIVEQPKWVVGFSDITALHLALNKRGIESIHGLMPVQYDYMGVEESLSSLKKLLFEGTINYEIPADPYNIQGEALGQVIGGNLSLVAESLGTSTEIETDNKILLLEEIDEYLYKIDRMFMQLKRAGKLEKLAGVIIGDFSQMKDTQIPFGKAVFELIADHFKDMNIPIAYNFPVGHEARNLAVAMGRSMRFEVTPEIVRFNDRI